VNYVVDANLSPRPAELLRDAGHDAVHVRDIGLRTASDDEIIDYAISTDRIVVSHDTDFGTLLAYRE
jgi:predicted nuclease of predicted toxin-antitoxin system